MRCRVVDLKYSSRLEAIDEEPLQRALHGQELLELREHFYVQDGVPHLLVTLFTRLPPLGGTGSGSAAAKVRSSPGAPQDSGDEARQRLSPAASKRFEDLRAWRLARARQEGLPAYVILTNEQLAEVAEQCPRTLTELCELKGFGESRRERYGKEILAVLGVGIVENAMPRDTGPQEGTP